MFDTTLEPCGEDNCKWFGEAGGARTLDQRIKSPLLYQLSYRLTAYYLTTYRFCLFCVDDALLVNVIRSAILALCSVRKCEYVREISRPPSECPSQTEIVLKSIPYSTALQAK